MNQKSVGIDARFYSSTATGIGRHVYELIHYLGAQDVPFKVTIYLKDKALKASLPSHFKAVEAPYKHYSLAEQTRFAGILNKAHHDLMVFPHFNAPLFYKGKTAVTIHDLTLHKFPGKKKTNFFSRLAYKIIINGVAKKADHLFAVSENTKQDMIDILNIKPEQITVTYNGVNKTFHPIKEPSLIKTAQKKYHLPENYFLYFGVFRSHKNILGLVEAFAQYKSQHPQSPQHLVLAGPKDQTYFPEIQKLVKQHGLEPWVFFPGFLDEEDINAVLCGATAFVFPSFYEGFGIPPIEAMQADIPVISSNTSSLPEACGNAALMINPYDINEMAKALHEISGNQELRERLISQGQKQSEKFEWSTMGQSMLKVYLTLLNEKT